MNKDLDNRKYIKLEDYKFFGWEIPSIFLDFIIQKDEVIVKTELLITKKK